MAKLTFKEYVESKTKLLEAVEETPQQTIDYEVRKYCKIPLGESKEEKEYVSLKPKHTMTVEWLYEDIDTPTPLRIWFEGEEEFEDKEFSTFWSDKKINEWVKHNTREVIK